MIDKEEILRTQGPHENIHCKNCAYNLDNPERGDCEMFTFLKPHKIYFDGEECPLFLEK